MVGTIGYLGKVQIKLGLTCAFLYMLGATLSSSAFGAALGGVGLLLRRGLGALGVPGEVVVPGALALFLLLCAVYELSSPRFRIPQRRWQLERSDWVIMGRRGAAWRWGLVFGLGVWTPIVFPLFFALPVLALGSGSPLSGAIIMGSFGFTLGLWLLAVLLGVRWCGDSVNALLQSAENRRWSHRINGVAALGFGVYLIAALAGILPRA